MPIKEESMIFVDGELSTSNLDNRLPDDYEIGCQTAEQYGI